MKILHLAGCALACLMLAACGSTGRTVLNNVNQNCDREYDGTISAGLTGANFAGTFKAKCYAAAKDGEAGEAEPL